MCEGRFCDFKTVIDVNDKEMEAAAVTAIGGVTNMPHVENHRRDSRLFDSRVDDVEHQ